MSKPQEFTTFLDSSFVCLRWLKMADRSESDILNQTSGKDGCTDRFHAIFHMPRSLKKVDVIYICFLLFYNIELYINKILR